VQQRFLIAASVVALTGCNGSDPSKGHESHAKMQWVINEMGDTVKPGVAIGVTAQCPKGLQPITGAGRYSAMTGTEFLFEQSQPVDGGWLFSVRNQTKSQVDVKVKAMALCSDQVPPPPKF